MSRCLLAALLMLLTPCLAWADPMALDVFTSFESPDLGPEFGNSPVTAVFSGGASVFEGAPGLYHDGARSWRVDAAETTTVTFETPASSVEFFALDLGAADATVAAFAPDGTAVGTPISLTNGFPGAMGDFSNPFVFADLGAIGRLEIQNPGGGATYIDSFGFSPIPEPATGVSTLLGLFSLIFLRRRR